MIGRAAKLAAMTALMAGGMAGCTHTQGGTMFGSPTSAITYYSTQPRQKTVTVNDTRTEEPFFSMEIPVGKQLTIQFVEDRGDDPVNTPDMMYYQIWELGTTMGQLRNSMTVPNGASRRIDIKINQGAAYAEAPEDMPLRVDQNQPDWWSPKGGPVPESAGKSMYDN
jgi:hypothetical protein